MDHSEGTVQSAGASFRLSGQIVRMPPIIANPEHRHL
jgi:hypothetical protein